MRRSILLLAVLAGATSCTRESATQSHDPSSRYTFWRPAPVREATDPNAAVGGAAAREWRDVSPENLLLVELADGSRVAIELAEAFAPVHAANVRTFARAGWWDGAAIYRVQDNYVAQWGLGDKEKPLPQGAVAKPPAEYERSLQGL